MAFQRHHFQPDTPTNVFATLNPEDINSNIGRYFTFGDGNLSITITGDPSSHGYKMYTLSSLRFSMEQSAYCEVIHPNLSTSTGNICGIVQKELLDPAVESGRIQSNYNSAFCWSNVTATGIRRILSSGTTTYSQGTITTSTIIGLFYNSSDKIFSVYHDNVLQESVDVSMFDPSLSLSFCFHAHTSNGKSIVNFGQNPDFSGTKTDSAGPYTDANGIGQFYYQPPAGALALCTENLPVTTINPHMKEQPGDFFKAVTYKGNGGSNEISSVGFEPDFVWVKEKDGEGNHCLLDTIRGPYNGLHCDTSQKQWSDPATLSSFDSNGFSVGSHVVMNKNGSTFVAWSWKAGGSGGKYNVDGKAYSSLREAGIASGSITPTGMSVNTKAGFSIVKWKGNGDSATIPHGLSSAPSMVITKSLTGSSTGWMTSHVGLPSNHNMILNDTDIGWHPSSNGWVELGNENTFELKEGNVNINNTNENEVDYIAYCWYSVPGYSKFGSYTGNNSSEGPFVYTGFKPAFLMIKKATVSDESWIMIDSARKEYNPTDNVLLANLANEENLVTSDRVPIDFLSNGFKIRGDDSVVNGASSPQYIYMAFAEAPVTPPSRVQVIEDPERELNRMRSLQFDGSSYLSKDFSGLTAIERQKRTFSIWVKKSKLATLQAIAYRYYGRSSTDWNAFQSGALMLLNDDTVQMSDRNYGSGTSDIVQEMVAVFRDTSAWFHLVCSVNTIHSERPQAEVAQFYINGKLVETTHINVHGDGYQCEMFGTGTNYIGAGHAVGWSGDYFNGYLANFYFIAGQALEPTDFAQSLNGVWVPKQYTGDYGTNGFHLDFAPENMKYTDGALVEVLDASPNSNHWTAN